MFNMPTCLYVDRAQANIYNYIMTHYKVRRAAVFAVHAVSGHVDSMPLSKLEVVVIFPGSRVGNPGIFVYVFS